MAPFTCPVVNVRKNLKEKNVIWGGLKAGAGTLEGSRQVARREQIRGSIALFFNGLHGPRAHP